MAQINFAKGEVQCKIVYYGPAESGKTANLQMIHERSPERIRGKMTTIATDTNRTLFFDFLPLNLGKVAAIRTKLNLYAVPYIDGRNALRVLVLEGVDGIVFVADARKDKLEANREALANLRSNLVELGRDPDEIPIVFQANKMELDGAVPAAKLADALDVTESPTFDAVAADGTGVLPTLKAITGQVLDKVAAMMGGKRASANTAGASAAKRAQPESSAAPKPEAEPVFTPAWHREAPDDTSTSVLLPTPAPAAPTHRPSPAIVHSKQVAQSETAQPGTDAAAQPPPPAPTPMAASATPDLKKSAPEVESPGLWDDGPITDPFMEASVNDQPFPASGGGMGLTEPAPAHRPGRAVSVGAGGTRGRVRTKELPAFGWGSAEIANSKPHADHKQQTPEVTRPLVDRRRRQRPNWRAQPPSVKQMTAGAMAALIWLAATGYLVFELL